MIPEFSTLIWDQVLLPRYTKKDNLDIFLSPYIKGPFLLDCPLITTIHDLMSLVLPEYRGFKDIFIKKPFYKKISSRANLIIADSQSSKNDILRELNIEKNKIKVIPIGIEKNFFKNVPNEIISKTKKRYNINKNYLLYLGNFKPHKNVPALLQAYAKLPQKLKEQNSLVLAGKIDEYVKELKCLTNKLSITKFVTFTDFIHQEDIIPLYKGATIFTFISLYEGFGLPVLEAMACGVPVIASDISSLPEVAGNACILVNPKDIDNISMQFKTLLTNDTLQKKMKQQGQERAKLFDINSIGEKILKEIEALSLSSL